jgi:hypothetical protein
VVDIDSGAASVLANAAWLDNDTLIVTEVRPD